MAAFVRVIMLGLGGCARADHPEPLCGWMLEQHYPGGPPAAEQEALSGQRVTRDELEAAAAREVECMAAIDGIEVVDQYNRQNDIELVGGGPRFAERTDQAALAPAIGACHYEHFGLVGTAWLDQAHSGNWTDENLVDRSWLRVSVSPSPTPRCRPRPR